MTDLCSSPDPSRSGTLCYSEGGDEFEFVPGFGGRPKIESSICERGAEIPWDEDLPRLALRARRASALYCTNEPWWSPSRLQVNFCRGEHE